VAHTIAFLSACNTAEFVSGHQFHYIPVPFRHHWNEKKSIRTLDGFDDNFTNFCFWILNRGILGTESQKKLAKQISFQTCVPNGSQPLQSTEGFPMKILR